MGFRRFYDRYYERDRQPNPAQEAYDRLRIAAVAGILAEARPPLLVIGSGTGRDFELASPRCPIVAIDLSYSALRIAPRTNATRVVADATNMPFRQGSFSTAVCSEVLEHIPDVRAAIRETRRVVCEDGLLAVTVPNWTSWFGLSRLLGQLLTGRELHASGQPYDDWKSLSKMRRELSPEFRIVGVRGVWYLPPMHFRGRGLPDAFVELLVRSFAPAEGLLERLLPSLGHILVLDCRPTQS
jgi:SAM-dependent methyltransferase